METAIPIVIAAVALAFSFYTFIDSHRQDRRNVLLKVHELLLSDELQRARYLLFEKVTDEASVRNLNGQDYRDINRVVAVYNLLGIYSERGYVDEGDVLSIWGRAIHRSWIAAQPFLANRENRQGYKGAEYFERLAKKAREELIRRGDTLEVTVWRNSTDSDPA